MPPIKVQWALLIRTVASSSMSFYPQIIPIHRLRSVGSQNYDLFKYMYRIVSCLCYTVVDLLLYYYTKRYYTILFTAYYQLSPTYYTNTTILYYIHYYVNRSIFSRLVTALCDSTLTCTTAAR